MAFRKIGTKISLFVIIAMAAVVALDFALMQKNARALVSDMLREQLETANHGFYRELEDYMASAQAQAELAAQNSQMAAAIVNGWENTLEELTEDYALDYLTVTDREGRVLYRSHSDARGDFINNQATIEAALRGQAGSNIESGTTLGLFARGGAPVRDHRGEVVGAVACGYDLAKAEYLDNIKDRHSCEVTLFDGSIRYNTTLLDEAGARTLGTEAPEDVTRQVLVEGENFVGRIYLYGRPYLGRYSPLVVGDRTVGMLFSGIEITDTLDLLAQTTYAVVLSSLAGVALGALLIHLIAQRLVARPLKALGAVAEKLERGEIDIREEEIARHSRSRDEVGQLARALEKTCRSLHGYIGEVKERMEDLAAGRVDARCDYPFQGDFVAIRDAINSIVDAWNDTLRKIGAASKQVMTSSEEVSTVSMGIAERSSEQAASLAELVESTSRIKQRSQVTTERATQAHQRVEVAKGAIRETNEMVELMTQAMRGIQESVQGVTQILIDIDNLAFQTRILALNASIEAAGAGEYGRGFAVVAGEVRRLAGKTAESSERSGELIERVNAAVEASLRPTQKTIDAILLNNEQAYRVAEALLEVKNDVGQQSEAIAQILSHVDTISQSIEENTATSEMSAATSQQLAAQSELLHDMVRRFALMENAGEQAPRDAAGDGDEAWGVGRMSV